MNQRKREEARRHAESQKARGAEDRQRAVQAEVAIQQRLGGQPKGKPTRAPKGSK